MENHSLEALEEANDSHPPSAVPRRGKERVILREEAGREGCVRRISGQSLQSHPKIKVQEHQQHQLAGAGTFLVGGDDSSLSISSSDIPSPERRRVRPKDWIPLGSWTIIPFIVLVFLMFLSIITTGGPQHYSVSVAGTQSNRVTFSQTDTSSSSSSSSLPHGTNFVEEFLPFTCQQDPRKQMRGASSSSSKLHDHWTQPPKVVILAGPHKSGSTSSQNCMVAWTTAPAPEVEPVVFNESAVVLENGEGQVRDDQLQHRQRRLQDQHEQQSTIILPEWSWPAPTNEELNGLNLTTFDIAKNFAPYYGVLAGQQFFVQNVSSLEGFDRRPVIDLYRTKMTEVWDNGTNIVFGSEQIDSLVDDTLSKPMMEEFRHGILDILPWGPAQFGGGRVSDGRRRLDHDDIEVVINYRSPRVEQLLSLWKEEIHVAEISAQNPNMADEDRIRYQGESERTFRAYLSNGNGIPSYVINSLLLAHRFVEDGIKTTIIDLSGVVGSGQSTLCHVVACEVMQGNCTNQGRLTKVMEQLAYNNQSDISQIIHNRRIVNNTKGDDRIGLTKQEMDAINDIVTEYDCGLRDSLLQYVQCGKLRILHQKDLFSTCGENRLTGQNRHIVRPFSWVRQEIQNILKRDI
jgi:hypothetical protein